MKNRKIVVAGHSSLDMTPSFESSEFSETDFEHFIRPGKLLNVGKLTLKPGGCVSNTGGALHFFGADVTLMYKAGGDAFAGILENTYREQGYQVSAVAAPDESTSYTIIIAPPGCDRFFLHDTALNNSFFASELNYDVIRQSGFFHFGYPSLMRRFYENDGHELAGMYKKIKGMGLVTSLDTAAIDPDSAAASCDWNLILKKVLPYVDFFMPSIEELYFMLDRPYYEELQERAGGDDICRHLYLHTDIEPIAKRVLEMGCRAALIKCGASGMYLTTRDYSAMRDIFDTDTARSWDGVSIFARSFVPDRIYSGTGAGDTSIAAFIYGIVNGLSPSECLDLASGTGASCLTSYDALSGLLSIEDLKKKIASGWERENFIHV